MTRRANRTQPDSWTVMVYMVADPTGGVFTNAHVVEEVAAMRDAVARHPGARIVAQADVRDGPITRHFSTGSMVESRDMPQRDPGTPETIADFLRFGVETHRSAHNMVIFWGHGFGPAGLRYRRFVLPKTLRLALRKGFGLFGTPIDVVVFMSCQMSTIELAYETSEFPLLRFTRMTNHIVASQGSVKPVEPFPYDDVFSLLSRVGGNPARVATGVADALNETAAGGAVRFNAPFALVDVGRASAVTDALKELAAAVLEVKPFQSHHAALTPLQKAVHDALDDARTHELSLLDLGRLGRRLASLDSNGDIPPPQRPLLQRVRAAGGQLADAIDDVFVLRRLMNAAHSDTGASVFCPTHHDPGADGLREVPDVELAVTEDLNAYRTSSFAVKTSWGAVVDLAVDAE